MNPDAARRARVLHVLPVIGFAGAEQMAANLLIPLSQSYEVGAIGLYSSIRSTTEASLTAAGVPLWFLGKRPGFDPRMYRRLDRILREYQPDVIHSHLSVLRYLLPSIYFGRAKVAVHTVHNLAERETDSVGRVVHRYAFRARVTPVAVSRAVAQSVSKFYKTAEPVTIPNGIPVARFNYDASARQRWRKEQQFDAEKFLFIATGRLERQKNPQLLIRAFSEIATPHCHLLFAGDGPLRPEIEEQIQMLGLSEQVHLLGRRSDVRDCLAAADAFVMSSDWEGNPLGLMEAMASGLPAVATSVGGVPELISDGVDGFVVPPQGLQQLAAAMARVVESPALRQKIGAAARLRAESEFTTERMADAYDRLYRRLLGRGVAISQEPVALAGC